MTIRKSLTFAFMATLLSATSQVDPLFSDDFSTDTLGNYEISNNQMTYSATAGVSGGGGLSINSNPNSSTSMIPGALGANTPYSVEPGGKVIMKMMLKHAGDGGGTSRMFLGLASGQGMNWGANPPSGSSVVGGVLQTGYNLSTRGSNTNATNATNGSNLSGDAPLVVGNWYQMQFQATKPLGGENVWTIDASLQDFGPNGNTEGDVTHSFVGATRNFGTTAGLGINAAAAATFLNFGIRNGSWSAADNFSAERIAGPGTALMNFRTANNLAADGSQDLSTPAGDGVSNLTKFAFNMQGPGTGQREILELPNVSTLADGGFAGLPRLGRDGSGNLTLTYIRRNAGSNPGITYSVEFSNSLGTTDPWAVNPGATEVPTVIDATFDSVTVNDSTVSAPGKRFARVRITN